MQIPRVDITGLGENATDIALRLSQLPSPDGKAKIRSITTSLGGQIATALVACRTWGLRTRYVGSAGDDGGAEAHEKEFRRVRVEAHILKRHQTPSRLSYVLVEEGSGSRAVLWQREKRLELRLAELKKEWFTKAQLVLVDGENALATRKAAAWTRAEGIPVMCDFDTSTPDAAALLGYVDYPVLSSELARHLAGRNEPLQALPILWSRYKHRVICATLGLGGALAWDGAQFWYSPSYQVRVIDTTGAGDLFHAGFALGLLRGWEWQRIMDFACAAAGLNCTAAGARGSIGSIQAIERLRRSTRRNPILFSPAELGRARNGARLPRG